MSIGLSPFRVLVTVVAGVGLAGLPGTAVAHRGEPRPPSERLVLFGAATEGTPRRLSGLDRFEEAAEKRISLYSYYQNFHSDADFDANGANALRRRGVVPMLTWEPWNPKAGRKPQPRYSLDRIEAGDHDDYIRSWARQIATWGHPLWLRFAHEMNGDWYPWGMGVDGNTPEQYRAAWRRVHHIFEEAGARNVVWVWSPNITYRQGTLYPLAGLYPGDDVVDVLAMDGYNWGDNRDHRWKWPGEVFDETMDQLRRTARKPIVIAETGCAEQGGDKAEWIERFFGWLDRNEDLAGFVWFNLDAEEDWRITTSRAARRAFAEGVGARHYG
jgi:hypothetical protein